MGQQVTSIPSGAEGIKELVALAHQARGVEIVNLIAPPGLEGVPEAIPVAIHHGTTPALNSVASLFEAYRDHPRRKTGTARALTLTSFIDLVNRHKTADSAVFADTNWEKPGFQAVIDYHGLNAIVEEPSSLAGETAIGTPANLKHRVAYEFPLSNEWKAWTQAHGEWMEQGRFAEFIRDHLAELAAPFDPERIAIEREFETTVASPADLIRLSRGLQVHVESAVKQAVTLESGEGQISWEETHKDHDGKPLKVPGAFLLTVAPFFGGEPVRMPVSLRYRAGGGKVVWSILLYRPDTFVTERVRDDLNRVAKETMLPTFEGSPET
ncbi:DUF2303 family protein [Ancylobacter vacuolatus]|uniref:Uncharacterized protein YfdQ (DUF2303 family) n=1 Tax=Ancylobacter vacuolatus TaxID=223389 RepID=A0ABU0DMW9_9HYPH|nr:DUF2303 family protein [Ancylobacter vacuolatus]MDQ0349769.1 uncharacterized protein YfdQ (DUF2303 family) [Ancylobacter vacuolatus]